MPDRGDLALRKHLSARDPQLCEDYQRLPYILLPGKDWMDRLFAKHEDLSSSLAIIENLAWGDFVLDFDHGRMDFLAAATGQDFFAKPRYSRGKVIIRATKMPIYLARMARLSPWVQPDLFDAFRANADDYIVIETWESGIPDPDGSIGYPGWPDVSILDRYHPNDVDHCAHLYPNTQCFGPRFHGKGFCHIKRCLYPDDGRKIMECVGSDILMTNSLILFFLSIAYMQYADEYLVKVTPRPKSDKTPKDLPKNKPWLKQDLPHWIMIDPGRINEYRPATPGDGSHASPRPHERRGHWRELRSDRYVNMRGKKVFIKPQWIGETEWEGDGNHYKVRMPPTT